MGKGSGNQTDINRGVFLVFIKTFTNGITELVRFVLNSSIIKDQLWVLEKFHL